MTLEQLIYGLQRRNAYLGEIQKDRILSWLARHEAVDAEIAQNSLWIMIARQIPNQGIDATERPRPRLYRMRRLRRHRALRRQHRRTPTNFLN